MLTSIVFESGELTYARASEHELQSEEGSGEGREVKCMKRFANNRFLRVDGPTSERCVDKG